MTLTEAKILLEKRRIPYQTALYENEAEYWRHLMTCPETRNARRCKILALVIPSVNGVKDIELQFSPHHKEYLFDEMYFGGFDMDMSNHDPDLLEADILDAIGQLVDGKLTIISANDLKRGRWLTDRCFDRAEGDSVFGEPGFQEALGKIEAPKTLWQKLTGSKIQYEIYDWSTYRRVVK